MLAMLCLMGNIALNLVPLNIKVEVSKYKNGESELAKGHKINLCKADERDLELINGVAYDFATRLIEQRDEIQKKANSLPFNERYQAFEIVHGIGKKKAIKLSKYISLQSCK